MCARIGALQGLRSVFRDYIRTAGSAVVMDEHKASGSANVLSCLCFWCGMLGERATKL